MIYYGVSMKTDFLGGDFYGTFICGGVAEIPALLLLFAFIDRIGRKPLFAGGYFLAALCMLSNLLLSSEGIFSKNTPFLQFLNPYLSDFRRTDLLQESAFFISRIIRNVRSFTALFMMQLFSIPSFVTPCKIFAVLFAIPFLLFSLKLCIVRPY